MPDLIRDTTFGIFVNWISGGKLFPWPEQKEGFKCPERYLPHSQQSPDKKTKGTFSRKTTLNEGELEVDGSDEKKVNQRFGEDDDDEIPTEPSEKAQGEIAHVDLSTANWTHTSYLIQRQTGYLRF
jgi:hypothetical protein